MLLPKGSDVSGEDIVLVLKVAMTEREIKKRFGCHWKTHKAAFS